MINALNAFRDVFRQIYGQEKTLLEKQQKRYHALIQKFEKLFRQEDWHLFSTPGRTEIGGNHTDHNHGRVLAASVNLDSIAVARKNELNKVILFSEGYAQPFEVDLNRLEQVQEERGTTSALIRGIAFKLSELGYQIGGFNACVASEVLPGSGLSSSASIEVLIGTIFNTLFNDERIPVDELAKIGQFAENRYFGKPCGLMDQLACAVGGIIAIDFENPFEPVIERVGFDFSEKNYQLLIVDTGGNHADLIDDYASIPAEMKSVARALGAEVCREIEYDQLLHKTKSLREQVGDRALLRSFHFLWENERVVHQVNSLKSGDFQTFLRLVGESGNSSFKWLQNIFSANNIHEQGMTLALALTEQYLDQIGAGACRVHGGGFAGAIQVFLPKGAVAGYTELMESVLGDDSVLLLNIRSYGAGNILRIPLVKPE